MSRYRDVIFDFDGTIVDSLGLSIKILNQILSANGGRFINKREIGNYFEGNYYQIFRQRKLSLWMVIKILRSFYAEKKSLVGTIRVFEGMEGILKELREKGIRLGLVTINDKKTIETFFKKRQNYFSYIYASKNLWSKPNLLKRAIRDQQIKKDEVLYVGNEAGDFRACQKVGIDMMGVAWGLNNPNVLIQKGVKKMAFKPKDILKLLDSD